MIYKKQYIKEDFDFNKVKSKNILDDYKLNCNNIRTTIDKNLDMSILLRQQFNLDVPYDYFQLYIDGLGSVLSRVTDARWPQSSAREYNYYVNNIHSIPGSKKPISHYLKDIIRKNNFTFDYYDDIKYHFFGSNFDPNIDDPIKQTLIKLLEYCYKKPIDVIKDIISEPIIEYFVSPDNGIILILLLHIPANRKLSLRLIKMGGFFLFTGEVCYSINDIKTGIKDTNYRIRRLDEDFDFNKVKSKNILDEYVINPTTIRRANSAIPFDSVLEKVFHFNIKIENYFYNKINSNFAPDINVYNINDTKYGSIKCIGIDNTKYSEYIKFDNKYIELLKAVGFKKYTKYYHFTMFMNNQNIDSDYSEYVENFVSDYYKINKDNDGFIEFMVSPDNGIIFIINAKFRTSSSVNSKFIELPYMFLYTGDVLYNKNEILSVNEDFDFNKVKSKNILDEYKVNCNIVRKSIDKNLDMTLLLKHQFNLEVPHNYEQLYLDELGNVLSKVTVNIKYNSKGGYGGAEHKYYVNNIHSLSGSKEPFNSYFESLLLKSYFRFEYYDDNNRFFGPDFDPNTDDPIKQTLIKLLEYCYTKPIDKIKDIIPIPTIEYYVSPDNGIILIKLLEISTCRELSYKWVKMGGFFLFTGEVPYSINDIKNKML